MKKSQKIIFEVITIIELNEKEFRILKDCIDYTIHRLFAHNKPKNINIDKLLELREEIKSKLKD